MDYNNDGKIDIISGDTKGNVWIFLNVGTRTKPELAPGKRVEADGKGITKGALPLAGRYAWLHMGDWDADGLKDLLVGHGSSLVLYKNIGTAAEPKFQAPTKIEFPGGKSPSRPGAYIVDWDRDGKQDLLLGTGTVGVLFYKNIGTTTKPKLAKAKTLVDKKAGLLKGTYRHRIDVTDWNNDGKLDLLVGTCYSGKNPRGTRGNVWLFLGK